ncbi:hypothetical protein ABT010_41470 [Streptomyces sp. NPDC002668]|uniref:hypothetical protein n=1 Tax=Streptomyces sp. NPDC002668 TaxID=3154422 RepID=UPI0033260492
MASMFSWVGRVRMWWLGTPGVVRWVAYVCIPMGFGAAGLGIYGDAHHWWDNRGFLTNLASSLASLLFGVPTALFVLSRLGDAQAEARERSKVRRRATAEAAALRELLIRPFALTDAELQHWLAGMVAIRSQFHETDQSDTAAMQQLVDDIMYYWAVCFENRLVENQPVYSRFDLWVEELQAKWDFLDQELRPRLLEAGESWLPAPQAMLMRRSIADLDHPRSETVLQRRAAWAEYVQRALEGAEALTGLYES